MTPEQFTAILAALAGLITAAAMLVGAVRGLRSEFRATRELVNGKMTELLAVTQLAARKEGELQGRDFARGNPPESCQAHHLADAQATEELMGDDREANHRPDH